jgi:uncharacterized protein YecT (DUF1311 family)
MRKLLVSLLIFISSFAYSEISSKDLKALELMIIEKDWPACIDPRNYYDQVYCSVKIYGVLDDTLNNYYTLVRQALNSDQKDRLKKVQINWIHNRDQQCAKIDEGSVIMNLNCAKMKTLESLYFIDQMVTYPNEFENILKDYASK